MVPINNSNGNGNGKGPWWLELVKTVGPTAAIAIFLVYMLAMQIVPVLDQMREFMSAHAQQMQDLINNEKDDSLQRAEQWKMISAAEKTARDESEKLLQLQQQTCINTAKSPYQTTKCLEIRNNAEMSKEEWQPQPVH